jgi:hypothetical protein
MSRIPFLAFLLSVTASAAAQQTELQPITIATGVPLHVRVTRTAKLRMGTTVEGVLTEPVYVRDRLVLPLGSVVRGSVADYVPVAGLVHAQALLNGDVTPMHDPMVNFSVVHLSGSNADVSMETRALIRTTQLVRFNGVVKKPTLFQRAKTAVKKSVTDEKQTLFGPNKKDRALRFLYGQLPYHPQRIWAGTQFVADMQAPAVVELPAEPAMTVMTNPLLDGVTVSARLADTIDSKAAKKGDSVAAIVTAPVLDKDGQLLLPEGARLEGVVSQAKASRSFGRNGALRFAIRGVSSEDSEPQQRVYGTLTAAEGKAGENLTVDAEGNVAANPDKDRFVAPLLLALTANMGREHHHHDDGDGNVGGSTVASNGFGLVARVIALTASNADVALGFGMYALAKSIYFRFLMRGHEVTFAKDTEIEVKLSMRENQPVSKALVGGKKK